MMSLIKITANIGVFIIIIFGGIASLWANCLLIANLKNQMRSEQFISLGYDEYNNIIWAIQLTYLGIFIIASGTLFWAFKKSLKSFLIPWSLLKFCENIILVAGTTTLYFKWAFYGLVPLGMISFVLNVYISLCVYEAYKKMKAKELLKEYENDLIGIKQQVEDENCEQHDKTTQTDVTNVTIEIKKTTTNNEIKNNKNNPCNYIHTHIPNTN